MLSRFLNRDVLVRAVKTFFQAFAAALIIPATELYNFAAWKGAVLAAAAAAASAVWNAVLSPLVTKTRERFA